MNVDIFILLTLASTIILMEDGDKSCLVDVEWESVVGLRVLVGDVVQYLKGAWQKSNYFKDFFEK
jgi:hypothetical protein